MAINLEYIFAKAKENNIELETSKPKQKLQTAVVGKNWIHQGIWRSYFLFGEYNIHQLRFLLLLLSIVELLSSSWDIRMLNVSCISWVSEALITIYSISHWYVSLTIVESWIVAVLDSAFLSSSDSLSKSRDGKFATQSTRNLKRLDCAAKMIACYGIER